MNSKSFTTGKIYANYDELIKCIEGWIDLQYPHITGCEDLHVKARIVQRIVELTNEEYTHYSIQHAKTLLSQEEPDIGVITIGGLRICTKTGKVSVSFLQYLKNIVLFFAFWLHMFAFLVLSIFRRSPSTSSAATILVEGGAYDDDDAQFVKFCRQGPIAPLVNAKHVIIKTKSPPCNLTSPSFSYTSHPVIFLISKLLRRPVRVSSLVRHLGAPFHYFKALLSCPINVLISRDLAIIPIIRLLDSRSLIDDVVITTSSFASQFLWMKGLVNQQSKLHMVWYSQNFIPKMYVGEKKSSNLPAARHMRVDAHWVWTDGFKSYLRRLKQTSEVNVVGPILWYLPGEERNFNKSCTKIAVFDITPVPDNKTVFGAAKNYYTVSTIKKFVTDIVEICDDISDATGKKVLVLLKHKRAPIRSHHDSVYLDFLEELATVNANFEIIDHHVDLYGLLKECDLSISVPYTSTAYVAAFLEKKSIYYDPFSELVPRYEESKYVRFASGPENLKHLVSSVLSSSLGPKTSAG